MRIEIVGGGPSGLYFAVLARKAGHEVVVHERLRRGSAHGWGVVFWDDLLADIRDTDAPVAAALTAEAFGWHDQVVSVTGREPVSIPSSGYSIARHRLLSLLADRAEETGVELRFGSTVEHRADLPEADLVVAADGVHSALRAECPSFAASVSQLRNRFLWLGTPRVFDSFEFPVRRVKSGWIWAHAYGFGSEMSTFVVETTPKTWAQQGFDRLDGPAALRRLESVFADRLDGAPLLLPPGANADAPWRRFDLVRADRWAVGDVVLMGDAAHTTHFSIGSGTRLALEDAIALARALEKSGTAAEAAAAYAGSRRAALLDIQSQALSSARWFEALPRYARRSGPVFAQLLERRRSPLMGRLPVPVYLGLLHASRAAPEVTGHLSGALRRVLPR